MQAIFIDTAARSVSCLQLGHDYHEVQAAIGCSCFDIAHLDGNMEGDTLYVDDSGLVNGVGGKVGFFAVDLGTPRERVFAGNGVILAADSEGELVSARMSLAEAKARISFGTLVRSQDGGLLWLGDDLRVTPLPDDL